MPRTAARESAACRSPSASVIWRRRQSASSSSPPALRWAGSHSTSQQQQPRFLACFLPIPLPLFSFGVLRTNFRLTPVVVAVYSPLFLFSSPSLPLPSLPFLPLSSTPQPSFPTTQRPGPASHSFPICFSVPTHTYFSTSDPSRGAI